MKQKNVSSDPDNNQRSATPHSLQRNSSTSVVELHEPGIIKQSVRLQLSSKLFPSKYVAKKDPKKNKDEENRSANVTKTENNFVGTDEQI